MSETLEDRLFTIQNYISDISSDLNRLECEVSNIHCGIELKEDDLIEKLIQKIESLDPTFNRLIDMDLLRNTKGTSITEHSI